MCDMLEIFSPNKMLGYRNTDKVVIEDGWVQTGDRVKQEGDRIYFNGRNDGRINLYGK